MGTTIPALMQIWVMSAVLYHICYFLFVGHKKPPAFEPLDRGYTKLQRKRHHNQYEKALDAYNREQKMSDRRSCDFIFFMIIAPVLCVIVLLIGAMVSDVKWFWEWH